MLPVKARTPFTALKQTSAAASKIKNKILNTSSFFKVSLKTNNKALALALEAQKKRNKQLEKDIVYLQKEVEGLCFELATRKYKERKMVLILQSLHSNTLQHFDMVADLFPDSGLFQPSEDKRSLFGDTIEESPALSRLTEQVLAQPEISELSHLSKNKTADLLPRNIDESVFSIVSGSATDTTTDFSNEKREAEKRHSGQRIETVQTETSRLSSSLRDKIERMSVMFSQSGFDMKSAPCSQNTQTSTCEKSTHPLRDDVSFPCASILASDPEHQNKQEKTVLLNTTMEMTLSNAGEIFTVEPRAKKAGRSGKLKDTNSKEELSGSSVKNSAFSKMSEDHSGSTDGVLQTDDWMLEEIKNPEVANPQSSKILYRNVITSRIPKLSKAEAGNLQKTSNSNSRKTKFKSQDQTKSQTDSPETVAGDDDFFTDAQFKLVKARDNVPPDKNTAEEAVSKITCRRSRTKGRRKSPVTRKTVSSPFYESESNHSNLEELCSKVENMGKPVACKSQELPEEFLFCADEGAYPESEQSVRCLSSKGSKMANSGETHKLKCRETFVVSVAMDRTSSNNETRELGSVEQGFLPSPGSNCDAEKPSALMDESIVLQHLDSEPHWHGDRTFEDTQSSSKRPWVATQDSGSLDLDANSNNNRNEPLLYEECSSDTEFQKTKKARREEKSRSSKKKALQKECEDHSNDKKKKKKSSCRTKGFRSDVGLTDVPEPNDPSRLRRIELDRNKYPPEDLPEGDSHSEISDAFLTDSKPTESKSSVDLNSKQRGRKSKLQTSTKARNLRETFVVYKPQDPVSLTGTKMSGDSDAHIYRDEAVHQSLGRLLMDEVPPWLATDVSVVDTELGSLLTSPTRDTLTEKSAPVTTETSPAGRVLTSLTNTMTPSDSENRGRTRRGKCVVSYKEPTLNSKIRRGDKFTDSMFLRSPVFKDGKKKKTQKKTVKEPTMERSILVE